jgi:hypothetical protein
MDGRRRNLQAMNDELLAVEHGECAGPWVESLASGS